MNEDLLQKWIIHKGKVAFLSPSLDLKEINYQRKAWYLHICTWPIKDPGAEEIGKDKTGAEFDFQPELLLVGLISANKLRALAEEHLGKKAI